MMSGKTGSGARHSHSHRRPTWHRPAKATHRRSNGPTRISTKHGNARSRTSLGRPQRRGGAPRCIGCGMARRKYTCRRRDSTKGWGLGLTAAYPSPILRFGPNYTCYEHGVYAWGSCVCLRLLSPSKYGHGDMDPNHQDMNIEDMSRPPYLLLVPFNPQPKEKTLKPKP